MGKFDLEPYGISETKRLTVPEAENILYKPLNVFDKGFVRLVDYMGGDDSIVYAATGGIGPKLVGNVDTPDLFKYLHSNGIPDPFDFVQVKLHLEVPLNDALFWVYLKPVSINEYSGRYSETINAMREYSREVLTQILESSGEKGIEKKVERIEEIISKTQSQARSSYEEMRSVNFARELARIGLPLSNYTSFYLSGSLSALMGAVKLTRKRAKNNPNPNIIGEAISDILTKISPFAVESFDNEEESNLELKIDYEMLEEDPNGEPRYGINTTKRLTVPEAEDALFIPEFYLENSWFMPTNYIGSDASIVQSARVSYGAGTQKVSEDRALIRSLRRRLHTTPFEHAGSQSEAKTAVFVTPRQGFRHRMMKRAGVMGDFVPLRKSRYNIQNEQIKIQLKSSRQGRGDKLEESAKTLIKKNIENTFSIQDRARQELAEMGVPKYVEDDLAGVGYLNRWSASEDIHNAFHFLGLRNAPDAQFEIQELARRYQDFVSRVAPIATQAWLDYEKEAIRISRPERRFITKMMGKTDISFERFKEEGWTKMNKETGDEVLNEEANALNKKIEILTKKDES